MNKKALGRGLDALISSAETEEKGIKELKVNEIEPNLHQPRKQFDDEKIHQLAESIRQHGVVQPIIVRKDGNIYRIIAGERRWRASRLAGLHTIPVIIKDISNQQVMELALIENLQREDLNPIEESEAYEKLIKEYGMTQEEIARTVGKSRPAIANSLRLMGLCSLCKEWVIRGELTSGHARALLTVEDHENQQKLGKVIIDRKLNVRETERLIKDFLTGKKKKTVPPKNEIVVEIEDQLKSIFGTKVQLINNNKKGKIMIEYYSNDELDRILELMNKIDKK